MASMDWPFSYFIAQRNEGFPTVSIQCQFMAPSKFGDQLDFELRLLKMGRSSCTVSVTALKQWRAGAEIRECAGLYLPRGGRGQYRDSAGAA